MPALSTRPKSTRQSLGTGIYSLADLRAYLAYSGAPEDARRALPWLTHVLNPVTHKARSPDYSFSDLISLFVVRELRRKGVSGPDIREAEAYLREKWSTDRPFVSGEIQTDGRAVFVDDELIAGQIESASKRGQQVMRELVKDRLSRVRYDDGSAARWFPTTHVLVDPRVQFGEPIVEGTRVPTEAVAAVARRIGSEGAARRLAIPPAAARSAIAFEEDLAKAHG